ncbi:hypothetical protein BDF21DRAFT_493665 [Thamnidium elegans]|nr:hypothetical protein BDF21DRAFT_493665 [Thamnidium elegans]
MSYTIKSQTEKKRQSIYTCIRYATKLIKLRTDIRKHRTQPNVIKPIKPKYYNNNSSHYFYGDDDDDEEEEDLYDEKHNSINIKYSSRHESQLALPSRDTYISTTSIICEQNFDNNQDEEEEEDQEFDYNESLDDDDDSYFDSYMMEDEDEDSYSSALKKLSGISFKSNNKPNRAVLITLSSCSLAAANAARQRRQKIRISR